jgi:tetratricopeptide (TPR) repeat protein
MPVVSETDWVVVELEPARAARAGLPSAVAAPRAHAEAGAPLEHATVARWADQFAREHPEHALAPSMAGLALAEPFRRLALRLLAEERPADAESAFARALVHAPFDAASHFNRSVALRRDTRPEEALTELDEAEWAYAGQAAFHAARGRVYEDLGEPDRAIVAYERALELEPGQEVLLESLEQLGVLRRLLGPDGEPFWLRPADFERVVRHELAASSTDPVALVALGERLAGAGHWGFAKRAAELALSTDPSHAGARDLDARARAQA